MIWLYQFSLVVHPGGYFIQSDLYKNSIGKQLYKNEKMFHYTLYSRVIYNKLKYFCQNQININ